MVIKEILRELRNHIRLLKFKEKWRAANSNNATCAGNIFPVSVVTIGNHTYGTLHVHYYKQANEHLSIGSYCSIADDVHFFLGGEHNYRTISSFPFKNRITKNQISEAISKGPIIIADDVWIGSKVIILSGTKIGQGAVIGAGSVVRGNVPSYAIYAGGKVIKYRFSPDIIKRLQSFDFSKLDWEKIDENFDLIYTELNEDNIDEFIQQIAVLE